jgi:hypothetical protein
MKTITGKTKVWLSDIWGPQDLQGNGREGDRVVGRPMYSDTDLSKSGFTYVGEAEITLHILDDDKIVANKIDALKAEKQNVIAEAQLKANKIEERIQSLLAITYKPEPSEA